MKDLEKGAKGALKFAVTAGAVVAVVGIGGSTLVWGFRRDDGEHFNWHYVIQMLKDIAPYLGYLVGGILALFLTYQLVSLLNRKLGISRKLADLTSGIPVNFANPLVVIFGIMALLYLSGFMPAPVQLVVYTVVGGTLLCKAWIKLTDDLVAKLEASARQAELETIEE